MMRRHRINETAALVHLFIEVHEKGPPTLIENCAVQAPFLLDVPARFFNRSRRRCRHVLDLQIFAIDHCVVFADLNRGFSKRIMPGVGNALVKTSDSLLLLLPVPGKFHHPLQAALFFGKLVEFASKKCEARNESAVRTSCKTNDAHVQSGLASFLRVNRLKNFVLRLKGNIPTVSLASNS